MGGDGRKLHRKVRGRRRNYFIWSIILQMKCPACWHGVGQQKRQVANQDTCLQGTHTGSQAWESWTGGADPPDEGKPCCLFRPLRSRLPPPPLSWPGCFKSQPGQSSSEHICTPKSRVQGLSPGCTLCCPKFQINKLKRTYSSLRSWPETSWPCSSVGNHILTNL